MFNYYGLTKAGNSKSKFISLEEFCILCNSAGLQELQTFSASTPLFSFNYSLMTQVDELTKDKIF